MTTLGSGLVDEMGPDSGESYVCRHCQERVGSDRALTYHVAFECGEAPETAKEDAELRWNTSGW